MWTCHSGSILIRKSIIEKWLKLFIILSRLFIVTQCLDLACPAVEGISIYFCRRKSNGETTYRLKPIYDQRDHNLKLEQSDDNIQQDRSANQSILEGF